MNNSSFLDEGQFGDLNSLASKDRQGANPKSRDRMTRNNGIYQTELTSCMITELNNSQILGSENNLSAVLTTHDLTVDEQLQRRQLKIKHLLAHHLSKRMQKIRKVKEKLDERSPEYQEKVCTRAKQSLPTGLVRQIRRREYYQRRVKPDFSPPRVEDLASLQESIHVLEDPLKIRKQKTRINQILKMRQSAEKRMQEPPSWSISQSTSP